MACSLARRHRAHLPGHQGQSQDRPGSRHTTCFPPTPCSFRASAAHPRLRIGWRIAVPWGLSTGVCWPVPAKAAGTYPQAGPQGRHPGTPGSRLWAMERGASKDWARLTWDFRGQSSHSRRISQPSGKGGQGKGAIGALGLNGAVELGQSVSSRHIKTIFQPTSVTPHSHRRPPFFLTLIKTTLFPPLLFIASGLLLLPVAVGAYPVKSPHTPHSRTASGHLWIPRPVGTQPPSHQAGLTR